MANIFETINNCFWAYVVWVANATEWIWEHEPLAVAYFVIWSTRLAWKLMKEDLEKARKRADEDWEAYLHDLDERFPDEGVLETWRSCK